MHYQPIYIAYIISYSQLLVIGNNWYLHRPQKSCIGRALLSGAASAASVYRQPKCCFQEPQTPLKTRGKFFFVKYVLVLLKLSFYCDILTRIVKLIFKAQGCSQWCSGAWRSGHTHNFETIWQIFLKRPIQQRIGSLFKKWHKRCHVRLLLHIWFIQKWDSSRPICTLSLNFCCLTSEGKGDHYEIDSSHNRGTDFSINTGPQSDCRVRQLHNLAFGVNYSLVHTYMKEKPCK